MKKLLLLLTFAACTHLGPTATEPATVADLLYLPPTSGQGFTTSGKVVFMTTAAQYGVVFQCQHGRFAYNGNRAEEFWKRFKKDQAVTLVYEQRLNAKEEVVGFHLEDVR